MHKRIKSLLLFFILSGNVVAADVSAAAVETRTLAEQAKNKLAQVGAKIAAIAGHPLGIAWIAVGVMVVAELIKEHRMPQGVLGGLPEGVPNTTQKTVTFEDIVGFAPVKDQLQVNVITPIQHPDIARQYGTGAARGVLLYGPPGCGKTFFARALAGQLKATFIEISIATHGSKWAHQTSKNIAEAFEHAAAEAKKGLCVVFIDELDSLAPKRQDQLPAASFKTEEVNTLLKLVGETASKNNIIFVGATNFKDSIDDALRRAGRLDVQLEITAPDQLTRRALFENFLNKCPCATDIDFVALAHSTNNYTCADIKKVVEAAARETMQQAIQAQLADAHAELPPVTHVSLMQAIENHRKNIASSGHAQAHGGAAQGLEELLRSLQSGLTKIEE